MKVLPYTHTVECQVSAKARQCMIMKVLPYTHAVECQVIAKARQCKVLEVSTLPCLALPCLGLALPRLAFYVVLQTT